MTQLDPKFVLGASRVFYQTSFFAFVWKSFAGLHPEQKRFVPAWHVQAMCHELDSIRQGDNKRLVINIPPRHLKSVTVSVGFVAFLLGHFPEAKIIAASYGLDLARLHSNQTRQIMSSDWYKALFPQTRLAATGNTSVEIKTTRGGGRKAVSVGGAVTGHGADYIIIDDLIKAADAESEVELERARQFVEGSLLSRFDNPSEGRVVMIAQRLHELDPPGFLLEKGYRHLNLRAIAEEDEEIAIGRGRTHRRAVGEALFPEHLPLEELERKRAEMGNVVFNCQYQQNPIAPDGSVLRWEWFGTYDEPLPRSRYQQVTQSWDTGFSADPRSDFSVCTTWGFNGQVWHLLDVYRARLDYPDLRNKALFLGDKWEADRVLIEKAASGHSLFQDCFDVNRVRFEAVSPVNDKEVRFHKACAQVEQGKIALPKQAIWLPDFKRELQGFPRGRNDDQVDSFSQFVNWSSGMGFLRTLDREHPLRAERRNKPRRRR